MPRSVASGVKSQTSASNRRRKLRLKRVKSRELHAGTVYIDCDCYHRNGLQQDCPRTLCGGNPCMVEPWPRCDLGMHFMEKWESYNERLDEVPPTWFCGMTEDWVAHVRKRRLKAQQARKEGRMDDEAVEDTRSEGREIKNT